MRHDNSSAAVAEVVAQAEWPQCCTAAASRLKGMPLPEEACAGQLGQSHAFF